LLSVSNIYDNGWHVEIDGIEAGLIRANYVFSAAVVPAGQHEVKFFYYN
jgi:uncharacterized membrane protein YfhO